MIKTYSTEIILILLFLIVSNILILNLIYPTRDIIHYITTFKADREVISLLNSLGKSSISGIEVQ